MSSKSLFSSPRERRLWLWTLVVVAAIYSSLGPARGLADALRERNLLSIGFAVVGVLLAGAVAAWLLKRRSGWGEIGVALAAGAAYLLAFVRMGSPEERTHLVEYGIVAALIHQALLERARNGRRVPAPAALAVVLTALLGTLDEVIQATLPSRVFDVRDIGFNALAGFMMVAARLALAPQRRPGWRVWFLWLMAGAVGWGLGVYWGWFAPGDPKMLEVVPAVIEAGYMGVVVGGVLIGVLQSLVLRRHVARAGRWVLASVGAAVVVGAVIFGVGAVGEDAGWIWGVSLFGAVAGALQWLVLRRQVARAGWWVLASAAAWLAGMPLGDTVGPPALGAIYGAVTGTVLVLLLRQRIGASAGHSPSGAG